MKVLVVGNGGREHALVWKLAQSPKVDKIYCAPGNGGTALLAENVNIKATNIIELQEFAQDNKIDLTIVGPEAPLIEGIVDEFRELDLKAFGPTQAAAMLEGSKVFSKDFMAAHGVPTAPYSVCTKKYELLRITEQKEFPYVIKVDGLAAGKGALVIKNQQDLEAAVREIYDENKFGRAAARVLVEDFLKGEELSVFAITDGTDYVLLAPAQDHKRIFDNDEGPNTGGMGAYAPAPLGTPAVIKNIEEKVIRPMLKGMRNADTPYQGVLYCGLMIDGDEPSVVEFNARFGDPEAQVIIPLIESDLFDLLMAAVDGNLKDVKFALKDGYAACVVAASGGYPDDYEKGKAIAGLEPAKDDGSLVFLAGAEKSGSKMVTSGGRVLAVTAMGQTLEQSIKAVYKRLDSISFDKMHYRRDIGAKGLKRI